MKLRKKSKRLSRRIRGFARTSEAVSALEYAVLVGVVVVAIGAALGTFEDEITGYLEKIQKKVTALPTN